MQQSGFTCNEIDEICAEWSAPEYVVTEDGEAWYWRFPGHDLPVADNLSELFIAALQLKPLPVFSHPPPQPSVPVAGELPPLPNDEELVRIVNKVFPSDPGFLRTKWKDGIDIEVPTANCCEFVLRVTKPVRDQLLQSQRELQEAREEIERLKEAMRVGQLTARMEEDWGASRWKRLFDGKPYTPTVLRKYEARADVNVRRLLEQYAGTEVADVIASLVHGECVSAETEHYLNGDWKARAERLESENAVLKSTLATSPRRSLSE